MIAEAHQIRENQSYRNTSVSNVPGVKSNVAEESVSETNSSNCKTEFCEPQDDDLALGNQTMVQCIDEGTLVPGKVGTLLPMSQSGTLVELQSELGTMVINSDVDEQTMKSTYNH